MIIALGKTKGELTMPKVIKENEKNEDEVNQQSSQSEVNIPQVEELAPHLNVTPDPVDNANKKLGKKIGIVSDCNLLRIREGANRQTSVLAIIKQGEKVSVDLDNSTASFYEVTYKDKSATPNTTLIGYCLKEYISIE